ncbi:hypothetical protein D9M62_002002 [Escherichia coli]|nr:hypothetical protein [Escherichia coli]
MNDMYILALKTIRFRSLIAEALLDSLPVCKDIKRSGEIITACHRSADVVEHISQYAIDGSLNEYQLIQDLESALFLLDVFGAELLNSKSFVPDGNEIKKLMAEVGSIK